MQKVLLYLLRGGVALRLNVNRHPRKVVNLVNPHSGRTVNLNLVKRPEGYRKGQLSS